jgi:hypothetical protein
MCGTIAIGVFYVIHADAKLAAGQQLIAQLAVSQLSGGKSHNKYVHKERERSPYVPRIQRMQAVPCKLYTAIELKING